MRVYYIWSSRCVVINLYDGINSEAKLNRLIRLFSFSLSGSNNTCCLQYKADVPHSGGSLHSILIIASQLTKPAATTDV